MIDYWFERVREANAELIHEGTDLRKAKWRGNPHTLAGACYYLSETLAAIYTWLGYEVEVYTLRHEGDTHWCLKVEGRVIDPTMEQFRTPVPYGQARRIGFLTKDTSKRTKTVLEKLGLDTEAVRVYR